MENYKYVLFQNLLKEAYDERCYGVYDGKTIVVQGCSLRQKFLSVVREAPAHYLR